MLGQVREHGCGLIECLSHLKAESCPDMPHLWPGDVRCSALPGQCFMPQPPGRKSMVRLHIQYAHNAVT